MLARAAGAGLGALDVRETAGPYLRDPDGGVIQVLHHITPRPAFVADLGHDIAARSGVLMPYLANTAGAEIAMPSLRPENFSFPFGQRL